eukprot:5872120-Pleurochrysis_carterae.AAC.1
MTALALTSKMPTATMLQQVLTVVPPIPTRSSPARVWRSRLVRACKRSVFNTTLNAGRVHRLFQGDGARDRHVGRIELHSTSMP